MRAETIHVTDHAMLRWKQRASKTGDVNVHEIIKAVKESKVVKKKEFLPYRMPRFDGSVYSVNGPVLFILESVTIDEYRLITVISEELPKQKSLPPKRRHKPLKKELATHESNELSPKPKTKRLKSHWLSLDEKFNAITCEVDYGPSGNWTAVGPVHVQPSLPRLPDMAPQGDDGLSDAVEQNSAA